MYCGHCGKKIEKANAKFCGSCGSPIVVVPEQPKVVYVEEKPLTPILEDRTVVALTFCVLLLSILTIVVTSVITKDNGVNQLKSGYCVVEKQ